MSAGSSRLPTPFRWSMWPGRMRVRPSISQEDALRNAPAQANGLFMVPKIVE